MFESNGQFTEWANLIVYIILSTTVLHVDGYLHAAGTSNSNWGGHCDSFSILNIYF